MTGSILIRLIAGNTLTPIEDTEDIWNECSYREAEYTTYQCKRMSSLFKDVYPDGTVKYHDVNRYYCVDIDSPDATYTTGLCGGIVDETFPIEMPYYPPSGKYKVVCETLLTDPKNGDFDIKAVLYIVDTDGVHHYINRYFDGRGEGWKEVDEEAWDKLKMLANGWGEKED